MGVVNGDKFKAPHKCCHEVLCLSDRKWSVKVDKTAAIVGECIERRMEPKLIHMSYAALSVTVQI